MSVHPLSPKKPSGVSYRREALLDWMETHARVMGFWLDCLIADGDDNEVVSMLHRQHAWLSMMQETLRRSA